MSTKKSKAVPGEGSALKKEYFDSCENTVLPVKSQDLLGDFQAEAHRHGLDIPGDLIPGERKRFGKNKNQWCEFYSNPNGTAGGIFGDWSTGLKQKWFSGNVDGSPVSPADQAEMKKLLDQQRKESKIKREEKYHQAAKNAEALYFNSPPATTHPYLTNKQIKPYNAHIIGGELLTPAWDTNGKFRTLQRIFVDADGKMQKRNYAGASSKNVFTIIGNGIQISEKDLACLSDDIKFAYLAEGFATAATIHQCTEEPVISCLNADNLMVVAEYFKKKYPDTTFVIAADNDEETAKTLGKNPGRIAAQAVSEALDIGVTHCTVNSDFNDLYCLHGAQAVRNILLCVVGGEDEKEKIPVESITLFDLMKLNPQINPLVVGLINVGEGMIIHAPGGLGKSMLALNMAIEMALNNPDLLFDKFKITRRITSMFIQTENSGATVNARIRKMVGNDPERIEALKYISMPVIHKDILAKGCPFSDETFQAWLDAVVAKAGKAMGQPVDILYVDPLISFSAGDENDSAKMRQELDALSEVSRKCGVTPIVIHHDNRAGDYRGASAIYDWCRGMIGMKQEFIGSDRITDIQGDDVTHRTASVPCIRIIHEKANNMGKFMPFLVRMDQSLNFQPVDEAMSPEQMEQGGLIQQALTDLGGHAKSRNELATIYSELSGVSKTSACTHITTAVNNQIIIMESIIQNGKQAYKYTLPKE